MDCTPYGSEFGFPFESGIIGFFFSSLHFPLSCPDPPSLERKERERCFLYAELDFSGYLKGILKRSFDALSLSQKKSVREKSNGVWGIGKCELGVFLGYLL